MTERHDDIEGSLPSPEATEALLRLLVSSGGQRISSANLDGRTVWIKRYDVVGPPLPKRLHAFISPILPAPFLRASKTADAKGMVGRELRKMAAFRRAGFAVPSLVFRNETVMVLSHVSGIVQDELSRIGRLDPGAHDDLLIGAAAALGRAHQAGLCHGRPHPRDMFLADGQWGFVDFEEEPEAVMPLRAAQGRDLWLLFLQICTQALLPETEDRALAAYAEEAPAGSLAAAKSIVAAFSPLLPPLFLLEKVSLGSDGRRILKATRFLRRALPQTEAESAARENVRLGSVGGLKEGP